MIAGRDANIFCAAPCFLFNFYKKLINFAKHFYAK